MGMKGMDPEIKKTVLSLSNKASRSFSDFMIMVNKFDEMTSVGDRVLQLFRQELELFRRPPVDYRTEVLEGLIKANNAKRMVAYVEAGFRPTHVGIQNTSTLYLCQAELQDHVRKVKVLIDELQGLSEDGIFLVEAATESSSCLFDEYTYDDIKNQQLSFQKDDEEDGENSFLEEMRSINYMCEGILNYASIMRIVYNMLNLDYSMQEKIVRSLDLNSSSDELESYCLMWELRPYVDDKVMRHCWKLVQ